MPGAGGPVGAGARGACVELVFNEERVAAGKVKSSGDG